MKRASDHQITKDDAEAGTLDGPTEEPHAFQKAAPEVIAKRRILKVRRTLPAEAANAPKPSNPFASISAGPSPAAPDAKPPAAVSNKPTNDKPANDKPPAAEEDKTTGPQEPLKVSSAPEKEEEAANPSRGIEPSKASAEATKPDTDKPSAPPAQKPSDVPAEEEDLKTEHVKAAQPPEKSTDVVGDTGDSSKSEDPGVKEQSSVSAPAVGDLKPADEPAPKSPSIPGDETKASPEAKRDGPAKGAEEEVLPPPSSANGTDTTPAPAPSSQTNGKAPAAPITFGNLSGAAPLTFANAAAAGTGTFNITPVATAPAPAPVKEFKEAPVQTGEEGEEELFRERAKLYELEKGHEGAPRWKEKGVGTLKLNRNIETKKARLIMRTEATLKVILNSPIFEGFRFDRATQRSLRFLGYDTKDLSKHLTFLVRFSSREASDLLMQTVENAQKTAADSKEEK